MKIHCTSLSLTGLLAVLAIQPANAHSWAEMLMRIANNGTMVGTPGYMRGYASRATAGFNDGMDTFLIPPNGRSTGNKILATDSLCHPSQTIGNYSAEFPKLAAAAGDYVAIRYQENGHVTLPDINPTKPQNRGTVYIYGTDQPADDEKFLDVFQQWTANGTGGNGRGRLLATRNFDDGQCYQVNGDTISQQRQAQFSKVAENPQGTDLWCQNDFQLPTDLTSGSTYTLYWVWSWPTFDKAGAPTDIAPEGYTVTTNQFYTSCMDVDVTDSSTSGTTSNQAKTKGASIASSFIHGQDLNNAAVLSQLVDGSFEVAVPGSGNSTTNNAGSSGSASGTSTVTSAPSSTTATTHGTGPVTIVVTVTTTEAPVYVTVTVPASSEPASASPSTTLSSSSSSATPKTHTHVATVFDYTTVMKTVSASTVSASTSSASTVSASTSSASTVSASTSSASTSSASTSSASTSSASTSSASTSSASTSSASTSSASTSSASTSSTSTSSASTSSTSTSSTSSTSSATSTTSTSNTVSTSSTHSTHSTAISTHSTAISTRSTATSTSSTHSTGSIVSTTFSTAFSSGSGTPILTPTVQPFLNGTSIIPGASSTTMLRVPRRYLRRS